MRDQKRWVYVVSFISGLAGRFRHIVSGETVMAGFSTIGRFRALVADEKLIAEFRRRIPPDYPYRTADDKPLKIVEMYFNSCYETETSMRYYSVEEFPLLEDGWDFAYLVDHLPNRDLRPFLPEEVCIRDLPNLRVSLVEAGKDLSSMLNFHGSTYQDISLPVAS